MAATSVVRVDRAENGIAVIRMQDVEYRNMFSAELASGLVDAFTSIDGDVSCKVVVVTGYSSYFAMGGTQEGLLAIHEGKAKCTDGGFYRLPLDCKVPVISAMQGHAIGGGLAFGLLGDVVILSRESIYSASFMNLGVTPGVGATYIVPLKLGMNVGGEMLLSGRNYHGAEFANRGIGLEILPRSEVLERALSVASDIAAKPRDALILLKAHMIKDIKNGFSVAVESELSMHKKTFHLPEVGSKIVALPTGKPVCRP